MQGKIGIRYDEALGIIRSTGAGRWTIADADIYYAKLGTLLERIRRAGQPVRILIDATQTDLQEPDIQAHMKRRAENLYRPCDRVAIMVRDNLVKARARAVAPCHATAFFCSQLAAETWLFAYDQRLSA